MHGRMHAIPWSSFFLPDERPPPSVGQDLKKLINARATIFEKYDGYIVDVWRRGKDQSTGEAVRWTGATALFEDGDAFNIFIKWMHESGLATRPLTKGPWPLREGGALHLR